MNILIVGICGFVGSCVAKAMLDFHSKSVIIGLDNFTRPGSESNRAILKARGIRILHGDVRSASDLEGLPAVDWVIDAAANPSVLAGLDGQSSSRQVVEHNLYGTVNLLEYCRRHEAGFILLSTSRVYASALLSELPVETFGCAFRLKPGVSLPPGVSQRGLDETFSTAPPISLYGATKLASETLALEYSDTFGFPVWINRCGMLAGAGQFGRSDQGIIAYWINAYLRRRPLKYIGFGGGGHQVRDIMHPRDLIPILVRQMQGEYGNNDPRVLNLGGGEGNALSLNELSAWCADRFGEHPISTDPLPRRFDVPWLIMNSDLARATLDWRPVCSPADILSEIALHAERHPQWLELSASL